MEAALAHSNYYKNDLLIEVIHKYIKLIRQVFGPGEDQRHGYPGHPEIELALVRFYSATGGTRTRMIWHSTSLRSVVTLRDKTAVCFLQYFIRF